MAYRASGQTGTIALVGATGTVGQTILEQLYHSNVGLDIIIYSTTTEKSSALIDDLRHAHQKMCGPRLHVGEDPEKELKYADVFVHVAGRPRKPEETRDDLASGNAKIADLWATYLRDSSTRDKYPTVIVVSNPVPAVTELMLRRTGFPRHNVLGSGPELDKNRIAIEIAKYHNLTGKNMDGHVWGDHGNEYLVAPLKYIKVKGALLTDYLQSDGGTDKLDEIRKIIEGAKKGSQKIVEKLGKTMYGPAEDVVELVRFVLQSDGTMNTMYNAVVHYDGEYGIKGISMAAPVKLRQGGWEKINTYPLGDQEKDLIISAKHVANTTRVALEAVGIDFPEYEELMSLE